jgi:hypothetical protein
MMLEIQVLAWDMHKNMAGYICFLSLMYKGVYWAIFVIN